SNQLREVNELLPAGEGLIGRVAASGKSVVLDNVTISPYLLPAARRVVELEGIRGFVSVPIRGHRHILGTISLGRRVPEPFTAEDVRLLEATADQIAIALEHGRLNAELRQQVYELTRVQDEPLQAQRLAADANRAKDEFLATLSHELRTPLQSMLVCVDLLRRQELDQSITARTLDMLERSVRTQTLLIGDLLDMSRITAGKLRL